MPEVSVPAGGKLQGGRMGIRPQGALVLNHFGTVELVRKKTILGFREGETSLERAIAAEKVSDCLRGGVCVCVCVCVCAQLCPTLCNPMDYSSPCSSVHGLSQARMLEWVAISFSRGSSRLRDQTLVSYTGRWILYHCTTREIL